MPSGYLHQRCALAAGEAAGVTPADLSAFILGAQGPDPLFTLGMFPLSLKSKPLPYGGMLHKRRTGAFLATLMRRAKDCGTAERAYAMGFLTHYALDSTVHPYVYAHSLNASGEYSSPVHMTLEKRWDSIYYRADGHRGTPVAMPCAEETRAVWPAVARLWAAAFAETFGDEAPSESQILTALSDTARANRLTHSPAGVKYALMWLVERLIGRPGLITSQITPRFVPKADLTNERRLPWRAPAQPDIPRDEGLSDLYGAAVRRAGSLLRAAADFYDGRIDCAALAEIIGNAGYDTGMESNP